MQQQQAAVALEPNFYRFGTQASIYQNAIKSSFAKTECSQTCATFILTQGQSYGWCDWYNRTINKWKLRQWASELFCLLYCKWNICTIIFKLSCRPSNSLDALPAYLSSTSDGQLPQGEGSNAISKSYDLDIAKWISNIKCEFKQSKSGYLWIGEQYTFQRKGIFLRWKFRHLLFNFS